MQAVEAAGGRFGITELKRFLFRRWLRTVPLYYVLLIVNFVVAFFLLRSESFFDYRFLVWGQNLTHSPLQFFGESWSLCVEEWFYVLYPLGLFLLLSFLSGKKVFVVLVYTLLFISAGTVTRSVVAKEKFWELNVVCTRMDAIGYGVLFAIVRRYYLTVLDRKKLLLCGVTGLTLLAAAVVIFLKSTTRSWLLYYPLSGLGLGLLLFWFQRLSTKKTKGWLINGVRFYSKISYSIYLNNLVVIVLVRKYVTLPVFWQLTLSALAVLFVSVLTFRFIEKPFIRLREKRVPKRRRIDVA